MIAVPVQAKLEKTRQGTFSQPQYEYMPSARQEAIAEPMRENKGEPKAEAKQEAEAGEKPADRKMLRDSLFFDLNHSDLSIGGKLYESGMSFDAGGQAEVKLFDWLRLSPKFNFNYQTYGAVEEDVSETISDLNLVLDGRTNLYSSQSFRLYLGLGGEYLSNKEDMVLEGKDAYLHRSNVGPGISIGFDWHYLDVTLSAAELFGRKTSSYDRGRDIRLEHFSLVVNPRLWRIEMPMSCDYLMWSINNVQKDRQNMLLKLNFKPGIGITEHISLFGNLNYSRAFDGEDKYSILDLGGGIKAKW